MDQSGYGLIETMRVREGRIPLLPRHLARLERSLHELGLPKPAQNLVALVTPFSATGDAVLRLEVRDGRASVTVRATPPLEAPALIAAAEPHRPYPHKPTERARTPPEAATHYPAATLPRRRSIDPWATTSVVAPFACATIRYDQRTRRPDAASRLWPGKCVALWEWCETACGSCGGGLIERRGG